MGTKGVIVFVGAFLLSFLAQADPGCPPAPRAGDPVQIYPLEEIRSIPRGTIAYAFTVFEGTEPECFSIRIEGVQRNGYGPKADIIIFTPLPGRAAQTSIVHGMSGSPVYLNGKLLGALSMDLSEGFTVAPTGGITPAALMVGILENHAKAGKKNSFLATQFSGVESDGLQRKVTAFSGRVGKSDFALDTSGFASEVVAGFADQFKRSGFNLVASAGTSAAGNSLGMSKDPEVLKSALAPGSMMVVPLVSGDFSMSVAGTVTYNDGHQILGFGHPFAGSGAVNLPLMTGEVTKIVNSSKMAYKITNGGDVVGSLVEDRSTGVMGVIGQEAPSVPMDAELKTPYGTKTFHVDIADVPEMLPKLAAMSIFNMLVQTNEAGNGTTYKLSVTLKLKGREDFTFSEMNVSEDGDKNSSAKGLALWAMAHIGAIAGHPNEPAKLEGIRIQTEILPEVRRAQLVKVEVPKPIVKSGETLTLVASFRIPGQKTLVTHTFTAKTPEGLRPGPLSISINTSETYNEAMVKKLNEEKPDITLKETLAILSLERPNGALYAVMNRGPKAKSTKEPESKSWHERIIRLPWRHADPSTEKSSSVAEASRSVGNAVLPLEVVMTGGTQTVEVTIQ